MLIDIRVFDYDINGDPSPLKLRCEELMRQQSPAVPRVGEYISYQYWALEVMAVEWFFRPGRCSVDIDARWTDQKAFNTHYKVDR